MVTKLLGTTAARALLLGAASARADCTITVGLVMELTGPAGEYGQAGAKSVEMAFRDLNDAGGARGCKLVADIRDSQSQGAIAVDAANQLVQLKKVPVIIGGIISSVSIPILTSVTGPGKIVQDSPASSSPTLTTLGREGKTNGMFFRTITSDALQGTAAAKYALDQGFKKIAVIHVNNDFGVNMLNEFTKAYKALGGDQGDRLQPRWPLSHRHASRWRDDRPRLDFAGRPGQVSAQRRHEQSGLHFERRSEISQRGLRNLLGHQPDRLDRVFQRQLQVVFRRHRSEQSGGGPRI